MNTLHKYYIKNIIGNYKYIWEKLMINIEM